ncbi:MAG: DUF2335 domain-containing protein [Gloeomargaritaceae cyanobacterium C42_A2020_066]|nr:DUF2335 domain-containing protein [Gloeomargaritaceae cyanobacterium C42_A2020_066]
MCLSWPHAQTYNVIENPAMGDTPPGSASLGDEMLPPTQGLLRELGEGGHSQEPLRRATQDSFDRHICGMSGSVLDGLPAPEVLRTYDLLEPGLAGRILVLLEQQAAHRIEVEKAVFLGDTRHTELGFWLGFVLVCLSICSSTYLIVLGHDLVGGLLAGGSLASLVGIVVYGITVKARARTQTLKALMSLIGSEREN